MRILDREISGGMAMHAASDRFARIATAVLIAAGVWLLPGSARAQQAVSVQISVKNHRFEPAEIHVPANRPIVLNIRNLDAAAIEFESVSLRVEKVIAANGQGAINLRPLQPGRYDFFDDFRPETRGTLIVP
jgi:hypothetical protein